MFIDEDKDLTFKMLYIDIPFMGATLGYHMAAFISKLLDPVFKKRYI